MYQKREHGPEAYVTQALQETNYHDVRGTKAGTSDKLEHTKGSQKSESCRTLMPAKSVLVKDIALLQGMRYTFNNKTEERRTHRNYFRA